MKKLRLRIRPRVDINITPFIDILLVLLVIFMTISPTRSRGIDTNIPQPPPDQTRETPQETIILSMDRNGVIKINQSIIEPPELIGRLQDIFKTRTDPRYSSRPTMTCCSMMSPNLSTPQGSPVWNASAC